MIASGAVTACVQSSVIVDLQELHTCEWMSHLRVCPLCMQGCSGNQEQDTAPLLQMARLLAAMEGQRAASGGSSRTAAAAASSQHTSRGQTTQQQPQEGEGVVASAAASSSHSKVTQLLAAATGQLPRLLSDTMQLFPSDMTDILKAYRWVWGGWVGGW